MKSLIDLQITMAEPLKYGYDNDNDNEKKFIAIIYNKHHFDRLLLDHTGYR